MFVGFDVNGTHDVKFNAVRRPAKIFTLCTAFLAKEDTLSASARTVYTEDIRDLLAQSGAAQDQKASGESQRALSSEEVKALDKQAVAFIKKIHRTMVYEFAETPAEAAGIVRAQRELGLKTGALVTVPVPAEAELPAAEAEAAITQALAEADARGIRGKDVTPFLLARVSELTGAKSQRANIALLMNNARVAAQIAAELAGSPN